MSIQLTQIKGTIILASDNGSLATIGNATGTNTIVGATNINTTGNSTTTIGGTGTGAITIGTATTTSTNLVGTEVNLTNPRINQPISILYTTIQPIVSTNLNKIGGRAVYHNGGTAGGIGTGFFTTTGTTKQVYGFFNAVPTGRYLVTALVQMNVSLPSMFVDMKTVYNTITSPSFPQPLTLLQSATIADTTVGTDTFSTNLIDFSDVKPVSARFCPCQTTVIDISPTIGNQLGLAITFGTATVGSLGNYSLFLNFSLLRIS